MVIDLKYHLTTIIAIFLALGIGILVGSTVIGDDGMIQEQQRLIVQIEKDLNSLRLQNSQYRAQQLALEGIIVEQNQFVDELFRDAVADQLKGMRCLFVPDPRSEESQYLNQVLKSAGLDITDFTTLPESWQSTEVTVGWDLCLLMTRSLPPGIETVFPKERIYRPTVKDLSSKKIQYQLVKALSKIKARILPSEEAKANPVNEGGTQGDLRINTSVQ